MRVRDFMVVIIDVCLEPVYCTWVRVPSHFETRSSVRILQNCKAVGELCGVMGDKIDVIVYRFPVCVGSSAVSRRSALEVVVTAQGGMHIWK